MTNRSSIVPAAAFLALSMASASLSFAADAFVGTWKLNVAASKFSPGSELGSGTARVEARANGIQCTLDPVTVDGKARHAEWAAQFDGKDHPAGMKPFADTIVLNRIDAITMEAAYKKEGKVILTERWVFSAAGNTLTMTQKGSSAGGQGFTNVLVYERQ